MNGEKKYAGRPPLHGGWFPPDDAVCPTCKQVCKRAALPPLITAGKEIRVVFRPALTEAELRDAVLAFQRSERSAS